MATLNYNWQLIAEAGGSLNGNTCNVRTYAKLNSQSTNNNTSSVSYQSRLYYGGGYFETYSPTTKSISGTGAGSSSQDGGGTYNGGETTLQTITGTVTHDNNGNANVSMSANFNAGPWGYNVTANGSASLPKINRTRTNSVTGTDIDGNFSVNYTTYGTNQTYKLRISLPNITMLETIDYNTSDEAFTLSAETIEALYNRYTTTNTFKLGFAVETWNSAGTLRLSLGNEIVIDAKITGANPVFTDFDFNDINSTTLALTGNSKYNINGYSTIRVLISSSNKAIAQKGATMIKYRFIIGDATKEVNYSDSEDVYIDIPNSSIGTYQVYAIDSRNNSTLVTKLSLKNIEYTPLYIDKQNSYTERDDGGIGENVTLNYQGTVWNGNFGNVDNEIVIAKYEFKLTTEDDTQWVTGTTDISPTIINNSFSFNDLIRSNVLGYIFPVQNSYDFRITLQDKLSTSIIQLTPLPSGIPNISLNRNGVGIMCDYDENLGGLLQVGGKNIESKMDELYNDVGTRSVSVPTNYDFYLVRVGATANESMIVTIIDTNPTRYKYVSTHEENFSLTFIIQYNSTNGYIDYTQIGLSGWGSNVGYIFKVYGIKL